MKDIPKLVELAEKYESHPIIKGLIQLIPGGSSVDSIISTCVNNIRADRVKAFFQELESKKIELTPDVVGSEEFIHKYLITMKAVLNTRRREKIRMFARLFYSSITDHIVENIDEYEEYLSILEDLSHRELIVLLKLYGYEEINPKQDNQNDLQWSSIFWDQFVGDLIVNIGINKEEIGAILTRLNRSGCYETIIGTYLGYTGDQGKLTPLFYKLQRLIHGFEDQ